ncbi:MAG: hypothetical protein ACREQX_19225 [Candidatus Binataceae bacterium]
MVSENNQQGAIPWRAVILGALTAILFGSALWFYNGHRPQLGLLLLGLAFVVPMVWVIVAAREAGPETPLRNFIPRLAGWLVLGSVFLGIFWWHVSPSITAMEAGFAAFYIIAAFVAMRLLKNKSHHGRATLRSIEGRRPGPPSRRHDHR